MALDLKAGTWINKHGKTDKEIKESSAETFVNLQEKKEQYKEQQTELMERTIMGIDDPSTAGYDAAYNLGINEGVMERVNQVASDFKMDAFGSDAEIVEYYKNYDKIKAQEKAEVQAGYKAAYERERALEKSKRSIENTYEAAKLSDDAAKESKPNLIERFKNTLAGGDKDEGKVGTIVDDFLDFD